MGLGPGLGLFVVDECEPPLPAHPTSEPESHERHDEGEAFHRFTVSLIRH